MKRRAAPNPPTLSQACFSTKQCRTSAASRQFLQSEAPDPSCPFVAVIGDVITKCSDPPIASAGTQISDDPRALQRTDVVCQQATWVVGMTAPRDAPMRRFPRGGSELARRKTFHSTLPLA